MPITHALTPRTLFVLVLAVTGVACSADDDPVPGSSNPGTDATGVDGGTQVDGASSDAPLVSTSPQMTPAPNPDAGGGSGNGATP